MGAALKRNDLDVWRRAGAVLGYVEGRRVVPRRRFARADAEAQATWLREKFLAIKKKPPLVAVS